MKRNNFVMFLFVLLPWSIVNQGYSFAPRVSLEGELCSANKDFTIRLDFLEKGVVSLSTKFMDENNYQLKARAEHLSFLGANLLLFFNSQGELIDQGENVVLKGKANLDNSIINYKPAHDMEFYYEVIVDKQNNNEVTLLVPFSEWGEVVSYGKVGLFEDGQIDWNIIISGAQLEDFMDLLGQYLIPDFQNTRHSPWDGLVWGKIIVGGLSSAPRMSGRLEIVFDNSANGYRRGIVNFDGKYPLLKFIDSYIVEESGKRLVMDGYVDLNHLNNMGSPRHKVVFYPAETPYHLHSTAISTDANTSSRILISREFAQGSRLTMKSYFDEAAWLRQDREILEIDADLSNRKFLKMYLKDNEDIIGFGRRIRF